MRTDMVVVTTPGFDHDTRFLAAPQPFERQALAGELIDDGEALDLLAARAGIEHEVVGPDMVGAERGQRPRP